MSSDQLRNLRDRIDNQARIIESLREENDRLRKENNELRRKIISFTGVDPR
jgi:hypothetical protein